MPSSAYSGRLVPLLQDAEDLNRAYSRLHGVPTLRASATQAMTRSAVVMCLSAWEAYIEQLVREAVLALRVPVPHAGLVQALDTLLEDDLSRFNTPSRDNVRLLIRPTVGVQDISNAWYWPGMTRIQAGNSLGQALALRHQIAHGVHPRPPVHDRYAGQLPEFFRRLGRRTDAAVRPRLVDHHGIAAPWPP